MHTSLRIGEVATRSGVSIDTVRYYERRELLRAASRTSGGFRVFAPEAVEHVLFIKQAQALGFSLEEIAILLTPNGKSDCNCVRDLLDTKLQEINARMKAMQEFREKLTHYLAQCEEELRLHPDSAHCPVVEEIAHAESKINCCSVVR